jgi:glycosyltransferase involved in cell wall biosynthesis
MKKVLFVSIAFPPKSDPECIQTAKYFKYLNQENDFEITVLTSKIPTLFMPSDPKLEKYLGQKNNVLEIPIYENKYANFLIRKFSNGLLQKPDSKYTFYLQWKKAIELITQKPDLIYSRSFPLSSALMGQKLKEHYQVPWVMHLSDPWVDSPLHTYSRSSYKYNSRLEESCFIQADRITLTSQKAVSFYSAKYPQFAKKLLFFPNVFDEEDGVTPMIKFSDKLRIVYTGGLVEDRSAVYILEALKDIKRDNPETLNFLEIVFAGAMDRKNRAIFEEQDFSCVKHLGLLSFEEALQLQRTANILLVIDNPLKNDKDAMFFPSKLLDYIVARKRILAITTRNSSSFEVVEGKLGNCVEHYNTKGLVKFIGDAVKAFMKKDIGYFSQDTVEEKYSAAYNAKRLGNLFRSL